MAQYFSIIHSTTDQKYGPYANVKRIWDTYGNLMKEIDTTNIRTTPEKRVNNFQLIMEDLNEEIEKDDLEYLTKKPCRKPTKCMSMVGDTTGFTRINIYEIKLLKYLVGQNYRWIRDATIMKKGFLPGEIGRLVDYGFLETVKNKRNGTSYRICEDVIDEVKNYLKVSK